MNYTKEAEILTNLVGERTPRSVVKQPGET